MDTAETNLIGNAVAEKLAGSVAANARILGVSRQHLNNIIKGRKKPSADLILKIQRHFDISAESLLAKKAD